MKAGLFLLVLLLGAALAKQDDNPKPEKPEKPETHGGKPEGVGAGNSTQPNNPGKKDSDQPGKPEDAGRPAGSGKPDDSGKPETAGRSGDALMSTGATATGNGTKADKPERPERPERPLKGPNHGKVRSQQWRHSP